MMQTLPFAHSSVDAHAAPSGVKSVPHAQIPVIVPRSLRGRHRFVALHWPAAVQPLRHRVLPSSPRTHVSPVLHATPLPHVAHSSAPVGGGWPGTHAPPPPLSAAQVKFAGHAFAVPGVQLRRHFASAALDPTHTSPETHATEPQDWPSVAVPACSGKHALLPPVRS
jgi:hypothetical protein